MNHKDLKVWQEAMKLVKMVYEFSSKLPLEEKFGLTSQLQRAAVSVPTNLAEGASRNHQKEFIQFSYISLGSLSEIETLILISEDIYSLETKVLMTQINICKSLTIGFIKHLKKS